MSKKNLSLLKVLSKLKASDLSEIVLHLDDETTNTLCETIYNVLHTDLQFSSQKKAHLKRFIKSNCSVHRLKKISCKRVPLFKRKKCLSMEGRGLGLILASAIPFLTDLIFGKK
jgi:hypothetical protein